MKIAARMSSPAMPAIRKRLEKTPTERSEARWVRTAKAVPICPAIMPKNVIVVACW